MNAVEIVRAFHELDDKGRAAVLGATTPPASPRTLANEIAELPDAEREGVLAAIKQDFDASGKLKPTTGLSLDERVAQGWSAHPFRSGASLPPGVKLDVTGKAHELPLPAANAAEMAGLSGVPDGTAAVAKADETGRPKAVVGDKVTVGGKPGVVSAVEDGHATSITMADGTEVTGVTYLYADAKKAKVDAEWQTKK